MPVDIEKIKPNSSYTVPEASELLDKSQQSIRSYIKNKQLKADKGMDKRWRIKGKELLRFLNGNS